MAVRKNKKTGKWDTQFYYSNWKGERKRKHKLGFATKKEAMEWQTEFLRVNTQDLCMSFESFLELYKEDRKPRLKRSTWLGKLHLIETKILPYFTKKPMNEIVSTDIIKWQNKMIELKTPDGDNYSETYLKTINNQLTAIMNHAHRYYGLKVNPTTLVPSIGQKNADEMNFWTLEEYTKFADIMMSNPRAYYPFEILYWCGIRLGEMLALTYEDIDFDRKIMTINKSYQRLEGKDCITDPKTPMSKRKISIPDFLCRELKEYMGLQYSYKPTDRLFTTTSKSYLGRHIKDGAKAAGIKQIRVHDLRHSHVSHLIELGFSPVSIASRVGHKSIEITLRYAHLFPNKQSEMAESLNMENQRVVNEENKIA